MTAETYLDRIKKIDAMIKNKLRDRARWVEIAEGLGCAAVGERVQSSRNLHRGSDAIGNYIDIDREIDALKQERQKIVEEVERLPSDEYDVIYMLYVQDCSMKEVSYLKKKSYDWVKAKKKRGLDILQGILNEKKG